MFTSLHGKKERKKETTWSEVNSDLLFFKNAPNYFFLIISNLCLTILYQQMKTTKSRMRIVSAWIMSNFDAGVSVGWNFQLINMKGHTHVVELSLTIISCLNHVFHQSTPVIRKLIFLFFIRKIPSILRSRECFFLINFNEGVRELQAWLWCSRLNLAAHSPDRWT